MLQDHDYGQMVVVTQVLRLHDLIEVLSKEILFHERLRLCW